MIYSRHDNAVLSPLVYGSGQLEAALAAAENDIPVVINSSAVSGVSAPVTLAGSLVQLHAEMLAALVCVQLHRPGAPVVYSGHPVAMDMRTGQAVMGAPEIGLLSAGCVQMAHPLGLPAGSDGLTADSCAADAQAASEKWASGLAPLLAGAHVNGAAGAFGTQSTVSLEQLALDDEIYAAMLRLARGYRIDSETLAAEVIARVGPNGVFLTEEHTLVHMRREFWYPRLASREGFALWTERGGQTIIERAGEYVRQALANAPAPLLSAECEREVDRLSAAAQEALRDTDVPI